MSGTHIASHAKMCHNSVEITHNDECMVERIWDILNGGQEEDNVHGCVDIKYVSSPLSEPLHEMPFVIPEQLHCHLNKKDWFFIMEMQNIALFSSSTSSLFPTVFCRCLSSYNARDILFEEHRRELMNIGYRDCWMNCRNSVIPNGIRMVFKRKCLDVALPPFAAYERLMRYGFNVRAGYWCDDSIDNSGAWENGEHIHMDTDLMEEIEIQLL